MELNQAEALVLAEGAGEDGISVGVRSGDIPSAARMAPLLEALETLYHRLRGRSSIERNLCRALYGLSFHIQGEMDGLLSHGANVREAFVDDEMVRMFLLIESIFEDEWILD